MTEELNKGNYFQNLVKKHFLQNTKTCVQMEPDEEFVKNQNEIEKNFLKNIELTDSLKEKIVKESVSMKEEQEKQTGILKFFIVFFN